MPGLKRPPYVSTLGGLVSAQTFAFRARLWFGTNVESDRVYDGLAPGQAFVVAGRRPDCLSIHEVYDDPVMSEALKKSHGGSFKPLGEYRSNGVRQLEFDQRIDKYIESKASS